MDNRLVDGDPGLLLSPHCKVLRNGFAGGYHYRRVKVAGDLAGGEQAVVLEARLRRRGEDQGGLRRVLSVAGERIAE